MKKILNLCLPFALYSVLAASSAQINAHFILLAKHLKFPEKDFILLERREHLWELPHVSTNADYLKTDAGLLESVSRATFRTVPINPQHVEKFDVQGKEMVFLAWSEREVNSLLLEHEVNRLNALNPQVRELRWFEYNVDAYKNKLNFIETQCLSIEEKVSPFVLAFNDFSIKVLRHISVVSRINSIISGLNVGYWVESLNLVRGAEPSVERRDFMIASKYVKFQHFWYFVEQNGSYTLPQVPGVNSANDYHAMVQQHYQLTYKTDASMYKEVSTLYKDAKTDQYYSDIFHVHSAQFKTTTTLKGSLWCDPFRVAKACNNPSTTISLPCLNENESFKDMVVAFDKDSLCPLLANAFPDYYMHVTNGLHTAGIFLIRTVNGKRYSLFMARDHSDGGWTVPGGQVGYSEDFKDSRHDPLLVAALRNLEEKTFGAIKLDIEQVEKECTTISKNDKYGNISRYKLCPIDSNSAYSSEEIYKKRLTVRDDKSLEWAGNARWILLEDILKTANAWKAPLPFMVNAETLSDNDSCTYRSNYRLYNEDISVLLHIDFPKSLESAIIKESSFNCAFMKEDIKSNQYAYVGALMLDAATSRVGFAIKDITGIPYIPLSVKLHRESPFYFTKLGMSLGAKVFSLSLVNFTNLIQPILNHDTIVSNVGVSKNIVLYDISIASTDSKNIEWIKIDDIAAHPKLSTEDRAVFADASCQESLKYWIAFYTSKIDLTAKSPHSTTVLVLGGTAPLQNPTGTLLPQSILDTLEVPCDTTMSNDMTNITTTSTTNAATTTTSSSIPEISQMPVNSPSGNIPSKSSSRTSFRLPNCPRGSQSCPEPMSQNPVDDLSGSTPSKSSSTCKFKLPSNPRARQSGTSSQKSVNSPSGNITPPQESRPLPLNSGETISLDNVQQEVFDDDTTIQEKIDALNLKSNKTLILENMHKNANSNVIVTEDATSSEKIDNAISSDVGANADTEASNKNGPISMEPRVNNKADLPIEPIKPNLRKSSATLILSEVQKNLLLISLVGAFAVLGTRSFIGLFSRKKE